MHVHFLISQTHNKKQNAIQNKQDTNTTFEKERKENITSAA